MTLCRPNRGRIRAAGLRGFTLMELLVAVAIAALLFAIGVPTFRDVALGSRLSSAANDLLASIQLARSEAIKRNVEVKVCASDDGATCADAGGWEQGWIVVDETPDPDVVLQEHESLPAGYQMREAGGALEIAFQPIGISGVGAVITACRADPIGRQERVLSVRASGTASVASTTAGVCPD